MKPARWRPAPVLPLSAGLHLGALAGWLWAPGQWPWWLGALVANHALLTTAGLLPRSQLLGPNLTRLPEAAQARRQVAITFDDGPHPEHTPRVLDMLDAAGARASFFCIGDRVHAHPDLARQIVARGHAVENHTAHHPWSFSLMGPGGMAREVAHAQDTIGQATGRTPRFFRAVAGLRNPFLDPVLHRQGLMLAHWTRRGYDTNTADPDVVLQRLVQGLAAGDILLLHDGHSARSPSGEPVALAVLPRLLQTLREAGLQAVRLDEAVPAPQVGPSLSFPLHDS